MNHDINEKSFRKKLKKLPITELINARHKIQNHIDHPERARELRHTLEAKLKLYTDEIDSRTPEGLRDIERIKLMRISLIVSIIALVTSITALSNSCSIQSSKQAPPILIN